MACTLMEDLQEKTFTTYVELSLWRRFVDGVPAIVTIESGKNLATTSQQPASAD